MSVVATSKVVGEYRVVIQGNEVVVELGGGAVAERQYKNEKQANKDYNQLTSRDKVARFVMDNG